MGSPRRPDNCNRYLIPRHRPPIKSCLILRHRDNGGILKCSVCGVVLIDKRRSRIRSCSHQPLLIEYKELDMENPYLGINKKVLHKTRIIKKFIWAKKLNGKWKFLTPAYVKQICLKNLLGIDLGYGTINPIPEDVADMVLDWYDSDWSERQTLYLKCENCDNELIASGSFVSDEKDGVKYKCTDCGQENIYDFDIFPFPVLKKNLFIEK